MTIPKIGEVLEYRQTGGLFEVKNVTRNWVILFSWDGSRQIMAGMENLDYLFSRVPLVESSGRKGTDGLRGALSLSK